MKTTVDDYFQDIVCFNLQLSEIYDITIYKNDKGSFVKSEEILQIDNRHKITKDNFKNLITFSDNLNRYTF